MSLYNVARCSKLKHLLELHGIDGVVGLETAGCIPLVIVAVLWSLGKQFLEHWLRLYEIALVEEFLCHVPALGKDTGNSNKAEYCYVKYFFHIQINAAMRSA